MWSNGGHDAIEKLALLYFMAAHALDFALAFTMLWTHPVKTKNKKKQ